MIMNDKIRCSWCLSSDLYKKYHDEEWGNPVYEDEVFFEFLIVETFQAGLSWITILNKRENFRLAFDNFDYQKIANYKETKIMELLQNDGIIRNKLKVYSAVTNAQNFMKIQNEFGSFSKYIWNYVNNEPIINNLKNHSEAVATSEISDKLSKDLKNRGFKFVGSTVVYALLQATGLVNNHYENCWKKIQN